MLTSVELLPTAQQQVSELIRETVVGGQL